jgi:hypothetical protein
LKTNHIPLLFLDLRHLHLTATSWIVTSLVRGFQQAENIKFTLEQQMVFFARLVGKFEVADDITPIKIENFD